ncbi:MAG: hypothetical protein ACRDG4_07635 [Chloroflexota bacterium]
MGYTNFAHFAHLTTAHVTFVTRAKRNLAATLVRPLRHTSTVQDDLVWLGQGLTGSNCGASASSIRGSGIAT